MYYWFLLQGTSIRLMRTISRPRLQRHSGSLAPKTGWCITGTTGVTRLPKKGSAILSTGSWRLQKKYKLYTVDGMKPGLYRTGKSKTGESMKVERVNLKQKVDSIPE